uniref:DoxX family protein n=1 Tax=Altererythrobacter segetis TaxID=1104773 RepID=UPI00140AF1B6|nr:DoxX family protein [Altererythrobacter segetis]
MASLAQTPNDSAPASVWIGRALSMLFVVFMLGASVAPKLLGLDVATQTLTELGWPARFVLMIGLFELAFTVLYAIPRTSVLGAILMTALLGGALATRMRVGSPLFSHTLFSIYLALFMWGGLWLRSPVLRALIPLTQAKD